MYLNKYQHALYKFSFVYLLLHSCQIQIMIHLNLVFRYTRGKHTHIQYQIIIDSDKTQ